MIKKLLLYFFLLAVCTIAIGQIKIPERPARIPFVIDSTNTLDIYERTILGSKLEYYCRNTTTEIVVMLVSSTHGNNIETYAKEIGQKWGIGKKGKDNGIVMLIAIDDRKMSIQNGRGIELIVSNTKTKQIIDEQITPYFKTNAYFLGINNGLTALFGILKDEFTNEGNSDALAHFIVESRSTSGTNQVEDYTIGEGLSKEDNTGVIVLLLVCLVAFIFIVVSLIRAATGRGLIGYRGTTIGGNGVQNNFYNKTRVNNTINFFSNRASGYGSFNSNSGSSSGSFSSSGSSNSSSSSGSGGTFNGGGASGSW
ncbi:TPM domain-containing protein [Flavobacterium sp. GCM10023249]|uniref:TPM domain-containing protein n=1 Tax=unclassified Flavobacterium TaxID=196869 RepID=UPI00360D9311